MSRDVSGFTIVDDTLVTMKHIEVKKLKLCVKKTSLDVIINCSSILTLVFLLQLRAIAEKGGADAVKLLRNIPRIITVIVDVIEKYLRLRCFSNQVSS